jgi:threonine dehydratase
MLDVLTLDLVRDARARIAPYVVRTPVIAHATERATLFLKAESLQGIGAFKIRGAFSLMTTLAPGIPGVVAHSSGNHAQAVARAAKVLGLRATIVMPSDAPRLKRERTAADGAEIVTVGTDSDERARKADEIATSRGFVPVPPYDHPLIAAGQGTAALELLEDVPSLDRFYAPVSGGGLMAGCATVFDASSPATEVIGVEPEDAGDTRLSLASGVREKVPPPRTIADGLRVRTPGERTFPVIRSKVDRIELVSDEELLAAIAYAVSHLRLILEPSGAASLALALREGRGRCGVLLSGGNVDPDLLRAALAR